MIRLEYGLERKQIVYFSLLEDVGGLMRRVKKLKGS